MKKAILLILSLLICQFAMADTVTPDQARRRAADFFTEAEIQTKASAVSPEVFKLIRTYPEGTTKSSSEPPAMYVFERETGGFAIVSADDVARPILGYSLDSHFPVSDMPENMRALLQWYADIIAYAREQHWQSTAASSVSEQNSSKVLLNTAQWSQRSPFNDLVPEIDGEKPPIGCVATAIAIVMRYHSWPSKGTGNLPSYDSWDSVNRVYHHINGFALGHTYNWDLMPIHDEHEEYSEAEKSQIARLLYDIAVMCKMRFSNAGSGSFISYADRLIDYFDYDRQMLFCWRSSYPIDNLSWEQMIKDEIDAGRPVLYSGDSKYDGHAFVIDGYIDRFFSVNWGWNGGYSGINGASNYNNPFNEWYQSSNNRRYFYTLSPIDGHENELISFYRDQSMGTHIMPDNGGTADSDPIIFLDNSRITHLTPFFEIGRDFPIWTSICTPSSQEVTRDFRFILLDRNGGVKETVSPVTRVVKPNPYTSDNFNCKITKPLADGDHIILQMNDPATGDWKPVTATRRNQFIFTSRPLSDLVEIGYSEPEESDTGTPQKDFYVKFYKDICWDIRKAGDSISLLDRWSGYQPYAIVGENWGNISVDLLNPDDPECDTVIITMRLPYDSSCILCFFNPVTEETMEINLEL